MTYHCWVVSLWPALFMPLPVLHNKYRVALSRTFQGKLATQLARTRKQKQYFRFCIASVRVQPGNGSSGFGL